ncbi:MAG: N-acetyltransferase [Thalassolituus maritimus]|uniref:GNAT family N-acetyltransferase n=1 Tax=Thalassolituus maritimus TaxID=484498 RepID=UPI001115703D|nr:GNAT family N-acetyltransferase [Thalassolituus maritimus]TPD56061.1 MAG: N-acetyltransferase [Thalassolituus maritimus]
MNSFRFKATPGALDTLKISGERVILMPVSEQFADDIFREFTAEITRFMMPPPASDISETLEFIQRSQESLARAEELVFAITDQQGTFLGCAGLHARELRTPELGIWIKKSAHGQCLGREAIRCLHAWASQHLIVDHFVYPVDKKNTASRRIAESLGGTVIKEQEVLSLSGNLLDEVVYRIPPRTYA